MSDELVAFLKARLDEDEQVARSATQGPWFWAQRDLSSFPHQGDTELLADEPTTVWRSCAYYCTWSGQDNLHRGVSGQPGHEHRQVTQVVSAWGHDEWGIDVSEADAGHIVRHDPARVLTEVAAKRRIIELHSTWLLFDEDGVEQPDEHTCSHCLEDHPCMTLQLLALPYAGHESYCAEWAPDEEANRG